MLIEFQVGNFLSFKDIVTFSMVASDIDSEDEELDSNNIFSVNKDLKLLKTAALYGANASGKSNLAKAMAFMKDFVINSSKEMQITDLIDVEPFRLNTETEKKPSYFQIIFILNKRLYTYGFEVSQSQNKVIKEWLWETPKTKQRQLFNRENNKIKINPTYFKEGTNIETRTRQNALFLSLSAQLNGAVSIEIIKWFFNLQVIFGSGTHDNSDYKKITLKLFESPLKKDIISLIKELDLSIVDIDITKGWEEIITYERIKRIFDPTRFLTIETYHEKYNKNGELIGLEKFDLEKHESEGTKKLFYFSGFLLDALQKSSIVVIDELDAKLHPMITHKIIELFNSQQYNPKSAQLIFMTHDTNLLNSKIFGSKLLRRDQIWFTEKNREGATDLYSLAEYDIPEDAPFEADYIKGRYGAIPFIGNFKELLSDKSNG